MLTLSVRSERHDFRLENSQHEGHDLPWAWWLGLWPAEEGEAAVRRAKPHRGTLGNAEEASTTGVVTREFRTERKLTLHLGYIRQDISGL